MSAALERWPDKTSRLRGGFYRIKSKDGAEIAFRMNADQERFIAERHGFDPTTATEHPEGGARVIAKAPAKSGPTPRGGQ